TRHRILGILTEPGYQIIFSDTPGIIDPRYKLHTKMMQQVKSAVEDADVALLVVDINEDPEAFAAMVNALKLKTRRLLLVNKTDLVTDRSLREAKIAAFDRLLQPEKTIGISAAKGTNVNLILPAILEMLPEGPPFFPDDDVSDRPTRFFVAEMI